MAFSALLLVSCWKQDPQDSTPKKLPPRSGAFDSIPVYGPKQVWSVQEKQYITSYGKIKDSIVPVEEYEVVMNGDQVMKYAKADGWERTRNVFLIIIIVTLLYFITTKLVLPSGQAKNYVRAIGLIIGISGGIIAAKPADIARDNAKVLSAKQLKHYQSIDPELNYFWDSIYNSGRMSGTTKTLK